MNSKIIDGKKISKGISDDIKEKLGILSQKHGVIPGLAVVYIGEDKASKVYAQSIIKKCDKMGLYSEKHFASNDITEKEVLEILNSLNNNSKIHGIIVQFPIPKGIDENKIKSAISDMKDVDCITPINIGKLYSNIDGFIPCTPKGAIRLLKSTETSLSGKNAVIVGRSNIVGKPIYELLLRENLTVTICHSKTKNLEEHISKADVVVAAAGKPHLIKGNWFKKDAIVIDVGTNVVDGKLVGDVEYDKALDIVKYITPVPGGVGPMTIAMLLENTLEACIKQCGLKL